jgi:hypothetical protein
MKSCAMKQENFGSHVECYEDICGAWPTLKGSERTGTVTASLPLDKSQSQLCKPEVARDGCFCRINRSVGPLTRVSGRRQELGRMTGLVRS